MSYLIAAGVALFIGIVLWLYFRGINPANIQDYAGCKGWCEAHLNGCGGPHPTHVPEQPVNTFTNLMYAAAGTVVFLEVQTPPALVFGLFMLLLCIGSAAFHGLATRRSGRLDVGAMYTVFSGLATYATCVAVNASPTLTVMLMLGVGVLFGTLGFLVKGWYKDSVHYKIAIVLIIPYLLLLERIIGHGRTDLVLYTLLSLGLFALAFLSWQLDLWPRCVLRRWGHGIWHLLTGVAIAMLFMAVW